jgi:putative salt-induced outer membrane protein YdiY
MRNIIAAAVATAALVLVMQMPAEAASSHKHRYVHGYSAQYPSATARQLHNLRAYERGDYYETYSEALPVGSRPWFEAKEREGGSRRF